MFELNLEQCRYGLSQLKEVREILAKEHGSNLLCECHQSAQAALPDLLARLASGDELAVEPILGFYGRCINTWARDIYHDAVHESHFKAEIGARFIIECGKLESASLCYRLKLITQDIVETHFRHIEEQHLKQLAAAREDEDHRPWSDIPALCSD